MEKEKLEKALFDFGLDQIQKYEALGTTGNESYVIESKGVKYFLRLSPTDVFRGRTKEELLSEVEFTQHLLDEGIPVGAFLEDKSGNYLVKIEGRKGLIRKFIDGQSAKNPTLEEIESFGALLGKIHKVTEGFETKHGRSHIWDARTTFENLIEDEEILKTSLSNGGEFFENLFSALKKVQEMGNLPKGMIHEDLGTRHVLFKNGKIVGIIDFDRCYYGSFATDLGQAIRGWCFNDGFFERIKYEKLIKAYETERKLSNDEFAYLESAIKFAFYERSLSFALRSVNTLRKEYYLDAKELLKIGNEFSL